MLRRLRSILAGVTLSLLLCEVAARSLYTAPWHECLIAEQVERNLDPFKRNCLRTRGPAYLEAKAQDVRRVLFLGDSFTAGSGVRGDENTFVSIIEQRLRHEAPLENVRSYEVLNGGLGGSHTRDWLQLWWNVHEIFDPDVVVTVFFLRDGTRISSMDEFFGPVRDEIAARNRSSSLYRFSYLYRTLLDRLDKQDILRRYTNRFQASYFGDRRETDEWLRAQQNLGEIHACAAETGIETGLVIFPILVYLEEPEYPFTSICDLLASFAEQRGIRFRSLLPAFRGERSTRLWVSPLDQHPNALGHAIAAEALFPFVRDLLVAHEARR